MQNELKACPYNDCVNFADNDCDEYQITVCKELRDGRTDNATD